MAHTYGGGGRLPASGTTTSSNPVTVSLNLPAGTTVLWLGIVAGGTTARAGGSPTFNGVALTAANPKTNAGGTPETCAEDWYLLDPPTGSSFTLSIPNSGALALTAIYGYASAASGKTSAFDNDINTPGNSTNPSTSLTVTDGAIWFGLIGNGAQTWSPTARSGTQIADWDAGSWGPGGQYGLKSGTGSQTVSWTFGTSEDWVILATSFKEVTPAITGSGTPDAQAATLSGSGASSSTGSGTPDAQAASLSGTGSSASTGTGSLAAQSASLDAAGTIGSSAVEGVGALTAQAASADGAGASQSTGAGTLAAHAATASGAGTSASAAAGELAAGQATAAGAGISSSTGAGALVAQAADLSGSGAAVDAGTVVGGGALIAGAAAASGAGSVPVADVIAGGSAKRPQRVSATYSPTYSVWPLPAIQGTGALVASEAFVAGRATLGETLAQKRNRKTLAMLMAA